MTLRTLCFLACLLAPAIALAQPAPPLPIPSVPRQLAARVEAVRARIHAAEDLCQIHDDDRELSWSHPSCGRTFRGLMADTEVNAHGIGLAIVDSAPRSETVLHVLVSMITYGVSPLGASTIEIDAACPRHWRQETFTPSLARHSAIIVPYLLQAIAVHVATPEPDDDLVGALFLAIDHVQGYDPTPVTHWGPYENGDFARGAPARIAAFVRWHGAVPGETEAQRDTRARAQSLADLVSASLPLRYAAIERLSFIGGDPRALRQSVELTVRDPATSGPARYLFERLATSHCIFEDDEIESMRGR